MTAGGSIQPTLPTFPPAWTLPGYAEEAHYAAAATTAWAQLCAGQVVAVNGGILDYWDAHLTFEAATLNRVATVLNGNAYGEWTMYLAWLKPVTDALPDPAAPALHSRLSPVDPRTTFWVGAPRYQQTVARRAE